VYSSFSASPSVDEQTFQELFNETQALLSNHPRTIYLVSVKVVDDISRIARGRYNAIWSLRRSAQRALRADMLSLVSSRAGLMVHSAAISQRQLTEMRRSLSDGPNGTLPRTSLGVTIPPMLPSRQQVRSSDAALVASGEVSKLTIAHDGDLTWGYEELTIGKNLIPCCFFFFLSFFSSSSFFFRVECPKFLFFFFC
jgi:hypothetical protein